MASYILREGPDGEQKGIRIDIPKDKAIYSIAVGDMGDEFEFPYEGDVHQTESPDDIVTASTGVEAIRVIYQRSNGIYEMVLIDMDDFLQLDEFKDGLIVESSTTTVSKVVKVKIDENSDWFLTVSPAGVLLSGVVDTFENLAWDVVGASGNTKDGFFADFFDASWLEVSQEECEAHDHDTVYELPDASGWTGHEYIEVFDQATSTHTYYKRVSANSYISDANNIIEAVKDVDAALKAESDRAKAAEQALDEKIDAEIERAKAAEESISGDVTTLSATVESFSATTVAEIERLDGKIDELSAATEAFSASTVAEIERLDQKIDDEIARATAAEESISGDVTTLSAATEAFSAATVAELERLDGQDIADGDYTLTVLEGLVLNRKNGTDTIVIGFDGDYGEFGE